VNATVGKGNWELCNVHARMRCEQPVVDIGVTNYSEEDEDTSESARTSLTTVIPDYQTSRDVMSAVLAIWSQLGPESFNGSHWGAIRFCITKEGKMTMDFEAAAEDGDDEENNSKFLEEVYDARLELYATKFCGGNTMPDQIIKMKHLFVVWPMGGLVSFQSSTLDDCHVLTTFGLTNPDMPAKLKSVERTTAGENAPGCLSWRVACRVLSSVVCRACFLSSVAERNGNYVIVSTGSDAPSHLIVVKDNPPLARVGMAGYGYELLILTRQAEDWTKSILSWACSNELLSDIEFLGRVEALDGLTVGNVPAGGNMVNVLIAPAKHVSNGVLPNGRMQFLIITIITEKEVGFTMEMEDGRRILLDLLYEKGDGQISCLDRQSVV